MAIDRPGFEVVDLPDSKKINRLGVKNKGLPFTTHSNYELIIKNHPPEKFGCTICHQGQGQATEGKAARGDVPHWEDPILPVKYIESSCGKCHFGLDKLEGAPSLSLGRELFQQNKCFDCHTIDREDLRPLAVGKTGPPLTVIGSKRVDALNWGTVTNIPRTKWNWHFAHLKNPKQFTPDTEMPVLSLTDEEVEALTNFVLGFTEEKIDNEYIVRPKIQQGTITVPVDIGQELDSALDEL
jgi:cytochrome c2